MANVIAIVPSELADGFRLAGARVKTVVDAAEARLSLLSALEDPDAGVLALAEEFEEALDPVTRRKV